MQRSTDEFLRHMLEEAIFIVQATRGLTKEQFLGDPVVRRAVVCSIQVIGEAAKQVPPPFRKQHSEIPWREIAGMRDRLIHGYITVNYNIVWDVVVSKLPELTEHLTQILGESPQ